MFRGPSNRFGLGPAGNYGLERDLEATDFERAMQQADMGARVSRDFAGNVARANEEQATSEAGRARLAMTPGVTRGGSTSTRSLADSPLMQGSSQRFSQFGEAYSYDPIAAGMATGGAEGAGQNAADSARYERLKQIPGINARQAAKLVYGRGDVLDTDPQAVRGALAAFQRNPTVEGSARAIEAGASPRELPPVAEEFDASGRGVMSPRAPVRGTPEYEGAFGREEDIRLQRDQAAIDARAAARAPSRDRISVRYDNQGNEYMLNLDTGEQEYTGQKKQYNVFNDPAYTGTPAPPTPSAGTTIGPGRPATTGPLAPATGPLPPASSPPVLPRRRSSGESTPGYREPTALPPLSERSKKLLNSNPTTPEGKDLKARFQAHLKAQGYEF